MKRKASLNLSIEAIVIVVIAFVVLGLGLGFVRNQFGSITDTTTQIQEQIKQQVLDDLRTGDKKLAFPASEITLNKKESKVNAIGIKNVKQGPLKYKIEIIQNGGDPIFGDQSKAGYLTDNFLYDAEGDELQPTESRIIPIRMTSETSAGTGQFKIIVTDETENTLYDSKSFFITVTG